MLYKQSDTDILKMIEEMMFPKLPYRSVDKVYAKDTLNHKICKECGGECCKRCGCNFSPDDFEEISFEALKKELEKGYISIEYIDGEAMSTDFDYYILRARNQGAPIVDFTFNRTPCILLTETGCKLSDDKRPADGRLMIPSRKIKRSLFGPDYRDCSSTYTLKDCCYEWKPHKRILYDLAEYFKDKDYPCSI